MIDIKLIHDDKDAVIANLNKRNKDYSKQINQIADIYSSYLKTLKIKEEAKAILNQKSKLIGQYKRDNKDTTVLFEEIEDLKRKSNDTESGLLFKKYTDILRTIPNLIAEDVEIGIDEDDNFEIKKCGTIRNFDFEVLPHYEFEGLNFQKASKISKSRFVVTHGKIAKLERALANFMLDTHSNDGYEEFEVPYIVNETTLYNSGQLPKFKDDLFKIAKPESDSEDEFLEESDRDFYLIPTAEVCLANLHSDEIIDENLLPLNYTAYTKCFRKEAGSAGRDTRGLIRVHQFGKVELFKYTKQEDSEKELLDMVKQAEKILDLLELPYRVVRLCSGDIGFCAKKTYDLEVWIPSQNTYRECSSCSDVSDFQARNGKIRYKEENKMKYVHMLNGSGMATGRILAAIIENYQNEDKTITVPEVLKPYFR